MRMRETGETNHSIWRDLQIKITTGLPINTPLFALGHSSHGNQLFLSERPRETASSKERHVRNPTVYLDKSDYLTSHKSPDLIFQ
ncbi:hypothetical protein RRG08_028933 [Elysia crispata]|uniref:Uncharacterized protein n=1 Tax=Elysia crispata TaxID=231223 RepID=A0AAE1AQE8_9GAST|nr:hypothetical protein RRG08_028933 [Elysia crispata]